MNDSPAVLPTSGEPAVGPLARLAHTVQRGGIAVHLLLALEVQLRKKKVA